MRCYSKYDDEAFGALRYLQVSPDKKEWFSVLSLQSPKLEDKEAVIAKGGKRSKYVPLETVPQSSVRIASCEWGTS